ncbi:MAG: hypothetical protein Q8S26_04645 [Azonexus sp.]|nr:hypothetical protein [Azonexus sp.]
MFDLYQGREVALPERVEAGRFRLLSPVALNDRFDLAKGAVLLSDGREGCTIRGVPRTFDDSRCLKEGLVDDSREAQRTIICRALTLLACRVEEGGEVLPSPLVPPEMADALELNQLDKALGDILDRGHLDEIVRRPRYSMKYESELVDVSRVRRMAPGALERLAARSEDWHRRTITAVLPKRLMSMVSDDEWGIYENKVFARLLDRLEHYLRRRLAETEELQHVFEGALKLDSAEGFDYRLRDKLCKLWGEATELSKGGMESVLDESKYAIKELRSSMQKIGLLRHSDLYNKVARSAQVPAELRHTNILNHDQHYRHLKTLWHLHQRFNGPTEKTPGEVLRERQIELYNFSLYLRMIIQRVLRGVQPVALLGDTDGFTFAGSSGSLVANEGEITLRLLDRELVFVPALDAVPQIAGLRPDGSGRLIVSRLPSAEQEDFAGLDSVAKGCVFSVNPLDFYCEEKIRLLVERFLWCPVYESYGTPIERLPSISVAWLSDNHIGVVDGGSWRLLCPLSGEDRARFDAWLPVAGLNAGTQAKMSSTVQRLESLATCRHCGALASFRPRDGAFKAECASCNTEWGIYSTTSGRVARMRTTDQKDVSFARFGSWSIEFRC